MVRIGLDVGGTFTDVVALDEDSGSTSWLKVPTNPSSPSLGVLDAVVATGIPCERLAALRLGTTLGVNALLTASGAKTGLITTKGFRDVLEIRRTHRRHLFDLDERFPDPLVPRDLRLEVDERVDAEGRIVRPLDEDGVRLAWRELRAAGVDVVAIVFLFSFENPAHERRAREIVAQEGGAAAVFLSSDVLPTYREYERTSTTVAAASIAGAVEEQLQRLGGELEARGLSPGRLSIMTNSGGALSAATVAKLPIATLLSGPVGGVEAARWLAQQAGWDNVLTLDMGGTSCDVSGVVDGVVDERLDMVIGGHTISAPTYDIETIGAGGGSIAWIDGGGTLRVGPQSAGSTPGPACYGRGGTQPTVTDANVVLGRYDAKALLGGVVALDSDLARTAIATHVAEPLGMTVEQAAAGILRIVNVLMTNAVRMISVERGRDVRDFTLVAYGGAGPAHAAEIARELSIPRVLIPPFPGCASAFGAVISGTRRDFLRTIGRTVDRTDVAALSKLNDDLRDQAREALRDEGAEEDLDVQTWLDVRYEGQAHELGVEHQDERLERASLERVVDAFHRLHEQLYGHAFEDVPVELVNLRVKGFAGRPDLSMWWDWDRAVAFSQGLDPTRRVYADDAHGFVDAGVFLRRSICSGDRIRGPAVIHQVDSTVFVPTGFVAEALHGGSLVLHDGDHVAPSAADELALAGRPAAEVVR